MNKKEVKSEERCASPAVTAQKRHLALLLAKHCGWLGQQTTTVLSVPSLLQRQQPGDSKVQHYLEEACRTCHEDA